jgi:hypothetical protein
MASEVVVAQQLICTLAFVQAAVSANESKV